MEELKYIIEDSTIAELLGEQNFTNKESAVLELVKNAFDAGATRLDIIFKDNELIIRDDGKGMNYKGFKRDWMHIGKSNKKYVLKDRNRKSRVLAGSKGVGRFALSRLGTTVQLQSQERKFLNKSIFWSTDWSKSIIEEREFLRFYGTYIKISGLRDKWNKVSIDKLLKYLSRTYNDNLMSIYITFEGVVKYVNRYFDVPIIGHNCSSKINIKFNSNKCELTCEVDSDEFKDEAREYCDTDLHTYKKNIDCIKELESNKELDLTRGELEEVLKTLGNFKAEFYFSLKESSSNDVEKFLYKKRVLTDRYESGIVLYRNSFSISSYDGTKDWLGLGKRSRKSPAAASHPTGAWRVRENQLAGKVEIDKRANFMLKDLSNRQGLDENIYYSVFIEIIELGIARFERNRQSIIRKINKKNNEIKQEKKVVDSVIKNPSLIRNLSKQETNKFISEIIDYKKENIQYKKEIHTTEERYKYDIRILNVLATSGLKATAIAHEMHNDRNSIGENYNKIIKALKKYEIWDFVNEKERTKYAYANIPALLDKNKRINSKLVSFMETMLAEVEKSNFFAGNHNILGLLEDRKTVWERDYTWLEIELNVLPEISYILPEDSVKVIFDNLILNSLQHNDDSNRLSVHIDVELIDGLLEFSYKDDGKGLDSKYVDEPFRILEVHETSRINGHGLGMWIVNNTVTMSGGRILEIRGNEGFNIKFNLGGEFNG
ncbi:Histidine kinase-, DNA gyrase B-, and HSP90-like ATPase [Paenibacillus polysaccharolyticus]|uniref:Histidine kinase-, DNA gyrase B-, and HSP90-like ATPase n=1 Tax=Paenibacillus polysaccharolyticus TaxID=582692 RepID=A0A1G5KCG9_9BACL|nr:ATP-binding protein [Paenibacillus polysaccharolyticus]SCY97931.1 Histidine kinase-, DNA gyrase B-, and HSP90-like ATPase [Paenibacillus polysaccharolyticus]